MVVVFIVWCYCDYFDCVDCVHQRDQSPLLFACFMGDVPMAEYLIESCGADACGADKVSTLSSFFLFMSVDRVDLSVCVCRMGQRY